LAVGVRMKTDVMPHTVTCMNDVKSAKKSAVIADRSSRDRIFV
jgi:hypothetical protein